MSDWTPVDKARFEVICIAKLIVDEDRGIGVRVRREIRMRELAQAIDTLRYVEGESQRDFA